MFRSGEGGGPEFKRIYFRLERYHPLVEDSREETQIKAFHRPLN
jgi:hypothetical protein